MEEREKKVYSKPIVKTEAVKLGIFGQYGGSVPTESKGFLSITWSWISGGQK